MTAEPGMVGRQLQCGTLFLSVAEKLTFIVYLSAFVWAACLLLAAVPACSGQECVTGCEANLTTCSMINYLVYRNITHDTISENEKDVTSFLQTAALLNPPPACSSILSRFMCNLLIPSCNGSDPIPIKLCPQMCYEMNQECSMLIPLVPNKYKPYLNCTDPNYYINDTASCSYLNNSKSLCGNEFANAGVCQPFNLSQAVLTGEICRSFVSTNIYVTSNESEIQKEMDSKGRKTVKEYLAAAPIASINCYKHLASMLCPIPFPTCLMVDVPGYNFKIGVPQAVCYSFCERTYEICGDFFEAANVTSEVHSCSYYNLPIPHNYAYLIPGTDITVNLTCRDSLFPEEPYTYPYLAPNIQCPVQTGKKTNPSEDEAPCGLKCPDASYSDDEWRTIVVLTQVGSAISLICMAFMFVSYLVKFEKRKFPASIHLNQFTATTLFSLSFLIGGPHPEKDVWCHDEGTYATQSNNTTCGVQGFFFIFFGLALTTWCCVIAFMMFYSLSHFKTKDVVMRLKSYSYLFYLFGWGLPLIFAIAALASESIGYGPPLAWCFIHFGGFGFGTGLSRDYPIFYIPVGVLFVVILVLFWGTVAIIFYWRRKQLPTDTSSQGIDVFVHAQIRVIIFIFVIFAICFTIFEWRIQIEAENRKGHLSQVGLNWSYCKAKASLNITDDSLCPGNTNPARINYPHTVFESFLLSGIGMLIFVAFGSDPGIYQHWYKIIILVLAKDRKALHDLVFAGKDPMGSRGGGATTSPFSSSVYGNSNNSLQRTRSAMENSTTALTHSESVEVQLDNIPER